MIDLGEARKIASEWHSGQWSALYSFNSSGVLDNTERIDKSDYLNEIELKLTKDVHELDRVHKIVQISKLCALWSYIDSNLEDPPEPEDD